MSMLTKRACAIIKRTEPTFDLTSEKSPWASPIKMTVLCIAMKMVLLILTLLVSVCCFSEEHDILKRRTVNTNCDPSQDCVKGDLIAVYIADCRHSDPISFTCSLNEECIPLVEGFRFTCGDPGTTNGTNSRCFCRDHGIQVQKCRCQFWPPENETTNTVPVLPETENGPTNMPSPYYCKNSSKQEQCEQICNQDDISCWKWSECFKGCCIDSAAGKKRSLAFCGDGSCNASEHPHSCPIDCCYQVNSTCVNDIGVCTPPCCQTQQCCLESDPDGLNGGEITYYYYIIGSSVLFTAVVILSIFVTFMVIRYRRQGFTPIIENDYR